LAAPLGKKKRSKSKESLPGLPASRTSKVEIEQSADVRISPKRRKGKENSPREHCVAGMGRGGGGERPKNGGSNSVGGLKGEDLRTPSKVAHGSQFEADIVTGFGASYPLETRNSGYNQRIPARIKKGAGAGNPKRKKNTVTKHRATTSKSRWLWGERNFNSKEGSEAVGWRR